MKGIIQNRWVKLGISSISFLYAALMIWFAYNSFMYELKITKTVAFAITYILINAAFFTIMFIFRKQVFTSFIAMILPPVLFFIVILNLSSPLVFVPPLIVSSVIFIASRNHETVKTILAACYILLYVLGIIAFLIVKLLLGSSVHNTRLTAEAFRNSDLSNIYSESKVVNLTDGAVSPDGTYRYFIVDVEDKSTGRILLNVEYNNKDKIYSTFSFLSRGYEAKIANIEKRGTDYLPEVRWIDNSTLEYKFPDSEMKRNKINDISKDYFYFLYE